MDTKQRKEFTLPKITDPLTVEEAEAYALVEIGANAHHSAHGTGVIVAKDDKYVTVEFVSAGASSFGTRGWRSLIENEQEVDASAHRSESAQTMVIKAPARAIIDEYGSWKLDTEFGDDMLDRVTSYLTEKPTFVDLGDLPKPIDGNFSRRIKELRSIDYNNTNSLMENLVRSLDYTMFIWARETSKAPVEFQEEAYREALSHLGKDAWRIIFHNHERNTDSERREVEKMLLNITNKSVGDIYDYQARRDAAIEISDAIENRAKGLFAEYLVERAEAVALEISEDENEEIFA